MRYQIIRSQDFMNWYARQTEKTRAIIDARLDRIANDGHFGFVNRFDGLTELKWTSGMRVYTYVHEEIIVVALYGGNKNAQDRDIKKAKKIVEAFLYGS